MTADGRILARGDKFYATESDTYVIIRRVAWDQAWADIRVIAYDGTWTKRQPLREGHLPFRIEYRGRVS